MPTPEDTLVAASTLASGTPEQHMLAIASSVSVVGDITAVVGNQAMTATVATPGVTTEVAVQNITAVVDPDVIAD